MSMECQMNVKSQSELDIGGRETCFNLYMYIRILQSQVWTQITAVILCLYSHTSESTLAPQSWGQAM